MYEGSKNVSIHFSLAIVALWLIAAAPPVTAQSPGDVGQQPVAAESIGKVVSCAVCHGANGEGNPQMSAPRIGGMAEWYLATQLRNFRQGIRGGSYDDLYGSQMRAMVLALDHEDEIDELARYFSTLEPVSAPPSIQGDVERGKKLYAVCSACHGTDGMGSKQMNSPGLKGQHDWYLVRQLKNFSNGLRGANEDDTLGQQMVPIMQTLPDEQAIMDVVAYINSL